MIQCFTQHDFKPIFALNNPPKLLAASCMDEDFSKHPRILHKHEDRFELLLIREGSGFYYVEDKYYLIEKGDIIICNSGILHDEIPGEKCILSSVGIAITNLNYKSLPTNHLISDEQCPVVHTGSYYNQLESLMQIVFELLSSQSNTDEICQHLAISILSLLVTILESPNNIIIPKQADSSFTYFQKKESSKLVFNIKNYLDENYRNDLCLRMIAEMFNLDTYYLSHLFKKTLGYSPMQYIYRRRIGEAQSLLINTNMSITSIASYVGFGNPNNFNIQFKKYVGISPRTYRISYTKIS